MASALNKLTSMFNGAAEGGSATDIVVNASGGENDSLCPSLSFKDRLTGCAACLGVGMVFSVLSWVCMFIVEYTLFGVFFTLSNLTSIAGFLFLAGPMRQIRGMFSSGRWIATTVYLASIVLTIVVAVVLHSGVLVLICCLVQFCAMWWYFLSYVPFARDLVQTAVTTAVR